MVEGFRIAVEPDELKSLLLRRAEFHATAAANIEGAIATLQQSKKGRRMDTDNQQYRLDQHKEKSGKFRFLAAHLLPEPYNLSMHELSNLELIDDDGEIAF